jgi:hypothetical protein
LLFLIWLLVLQPAAVVEREYHTLYVCDCVTVCDCLVFVFEKSFPQFDSVSVSLCACLSCMEE